MSQYAIFKQKLYSRIDNTIRSCEEGINKESLIFQVERTTGASKKMIGAYLDELQAHSVISDHNGVLSWQKTGSQ